MKFETPADAIHMVFGYASIITGMIDKGYDPLVDTDVADYLRNHPDLAEMSEDDITRGVADFYTTYDMVLSA